MSMAEKRIVVQVDGQGALACLIDMALDPPVIVGDAVIVEVDRGIDNGVVKQVDEVKDDLPQAKWLRRATPEDIEKIVSNRGAAKTALSRIADKIRLNGITFKPLDAHYSLSRDRLAILFGCDDELDLRRLFALIPVDIKARIEFRQVGARDECAKLGGIGPCGRAFCCCTWQREFSAVNVRMAKMQELPLTPVTINGGCGRLKCCLRFEYEQYCEAGEGLPFYGTEVAWDDGQGVVIGRDVLRGILTVRTTDGRYLRMPFAEMRIVRHAPQPHAAEAHGPPPAGQNEGEGELDHDHTDRQRAEPGPAGDA